MFVLGASEILTGPHAPGVKLVAGLAMLVGIVPIAFLYDRRKVAVETIDVAALLYAAPIVVPRLLRLIREKDAFWSIAGAFLSLGIFAGAITAGWLTLQIAFRFGGLPLAIAVGATFLAGPPVAWVVGKRRDREARNVLHGLLDHVVQR
jgi:predicted MFS family arabinose efflux permease